MSDEREIQNPLWRFANNHPIITLLIIIVVLGTLSDAVDSMFSSRHISMNAVTITKCSKYDSRVICQEPPGLRDDDD